MVVLGVAVMGIVSGLSSKISSGTRHRELKRTLAKGVPSWNFRLNSASLLVCKPAASNISIMGVRTRWAVMLTKTMRRT